MTTHFYLLLHVSLFYLIYGISFMKQNKKSVEDSTYHSKKYDLTLYRNMPSDTTGNITI